MNLPPEFIANIQNTFREDGYLFLKSLPDSIAEASARWGLTDVQPAPTLSYNFVAFAKSTLTAKNAKNAKKKIDPRALSALSGSNDVVLKMGVPNREMKSEMAALKLFNGEGACRLLECDEERYWMLLERLKPGVMLSTLEDDEEATHIAAEVMKKIWRPLEHVTLSDSEGSLPSSQRLFGRNERSLRATYDKFIRLSDWFDGLKKLRSYYNGGTGPLNEKLVERVD